MEKEYPYLNRQKNTTLILMVIRKEFAMEVGLLSPVHRRFLFVVNTGF
jgi:hypothetical protein